MEADMVSLPLDAPPASPTPPASPPPPAPPPPTPATVAVASALGELGKPYLWGGLGPRAFDCSGATSFAWRAAGVSLPHSAAVQYRSGPRVARDQLQPGDLVFYGRPINHVGLYIGEGKMVHAPQTGKVVSISPVDGGDYVGAVRPGA